MLAVALLTGGGEEMPGPDPKVPVSMVEIVSDADSLSVRSQVPWEYFTLPLARFLLRRNLASTAQRRVASGAVK